MELETIMSMTPSELEHHGVKGMKWGVIRARNAVSSAKTRVKEEVSSKKREYSWRKQYKNRGSMSTKDLKKLTTRVQNENQLKRNATTKSQKKAYRNRASMSDQRLQALVKRVNLEAELNKQIRSITNADKKKAKKIIDTAATIPLGPQAAGAQAVLKTVGGAL